ncbi:type II secretion system protein [Candidatus Saccharibacteria bacterium]|nr:type II secretion system protein [Candidatus Saccharibacteria bacterium]
MKKTNGFTVIEIIFVALIAGFASILFFTQKHNLEIINRDDKRKTSINALYYSLEEVFYKTNNYYPRTISSSILPSVDPALFTDPNGIKLGETNSDYSYTPLNCDGDKCSKYILKTSLENEADYEKDSKN